jgi:hypothetical protein
VHLVLPPRRAFSPRAHLSFPSLTIALLALGTLLPESRSLVTQEEELSVPDTMTVATVVGQQAEGEFERLKEQGNACYQHNDLDGAIKVMSRSV